MSDHSAKTLEIQSRRDDEEYVRDHIIGGHHLRLHEDTISWILSRTDCFIRQSRGNESVEHLYLYPYSVDGENYDAWDKVGQAVGNLQALKSLCISTEYSYEDDAEDEDSPIHDWEILARILRHVRQSVSVVINDGRVRMIEDVQPFARATRGHPSITSFEDYGGIFPNESLDTLFSTLTTLPVLESVWLGTSEVRQVDESALDNPESLTELLRVPSLRSVHFRRFSFTPALFQATANALIEGTAVTMLNFFSCSFPTEASGERMANGLSRNTSVISIIVQCNNARVLYGALAAAIPSNSTLKHLELGWQDNDGNDCLPAVFLALE
jgi:hypothetical protein